MPPSEKGQPHMITVYMHAYIHTDRNIHTHIYIHTGYGERILLDAALREKELPHMVCLKIYIHTYIHACMHTCIHSVRR